VKLHTTIDELEPLKDLFETTKSCDAVTEQLVLRIKESKMRNMHLSGAKNLSEEVETLIFLVRDSFFPGLYTQHGNQIDLGLLVKSNMIAIQQCLARSIGTASSLQVNTPKREQQHLSMDKCSANSSFLHDANISSQCKASRDKFMSRLPAIHEMLQGDIQAAYAGDPSSTSYEEIVLTYPGILAVLVYRLAHELYLLEVPLLPRMMTEWAHSRTGIDIHPGAQIGKNFFIDHGTGVVIGETAIIGDNVKLYQGVTLGALSFPKDERGNIIRGEKRHPTVEDNVTIYANATVLGGSTTVQSHCVVGSSAFVYQSIPAGCAVKVDKSNQKIQTPAA